MQVASVFTSRRHRSAVLCGCQSLNVKVEHTVVGVERHLRDAHHHLVLVLPLVVVRQVVDVIRHVFVRLATCNTTPAADVT